MRILSPPDPDGQPPNASSVRAASTASRSVHALVPPAPNSSASVSTSIVAAPAGAAKSQRKPGGQRPCPNDQRFP